MTTSDAERDAPARSGSDPDRAPEPGDGERERLAAAVTTMRLLPAEWEAIGTALDDVARGDASAWPHLSQLVFEAKVAQRFRAGRARSTLPPTKKVSALPWIGLACGALVLAVGGALGGGVVLVGVAVLSVGVFAVAFAGSRVAYWNRSARSGDDPATGTNADATPISMPESVADRLRHLLDEGRP